MVGEFIILYSCEIQSSGGKFKTSFINRKRNIRKGFILLWIPFDTYTGINLSIQSGGVRISSIQKVWVKSIKLFFPLNLNWTVHQLNKSRGTINNTEPIESRVRIFWIWDSFGLRTDRNVFVLPAEVSRYQLSVLWTYASGYRDKESIWVSISYNFQFASQAFLANRDDGHESGVK